MGNYPSLIKLVTLALRKIISVLNFVSFSQFTDSIEHCFDMNSNDSNKENIRKSEILVITVENKKYIGYRFMNIYDI